MRYNIENHAKNPLPMSKLDDFTCREMVEDYELLLSQVICGEPELMMLDALLHDALAPQL